MSPVKQEPIVTPAPDLKSNATTSPPSSGSPAKRLKYEMCKNWREKGNCRYGDRCLFAHGYDELTKSSATQDKSPAVSTEVKETSTVTTPPAIKELEADAASKFETP